ncbi:MAG TPA: hypothetical protein VG963_10425, partial [Polyangiaceae bacterium]|nr:hypothetical protein [Polyangiaceae bacterium]
DGSAARAPAVSKATSPIHTSAGTIAVRLLPRHPPTARGTRAELGVMRRLAALLSALSLMLAVLCGLIRPWYQSWGARKDELAMMLPGDELGFPGRVETRAISIRAPAERVFAWASQLGRDRAGFYSYELLEDLAGCEMPRLDRLEPALQRWSIGQKLWMYPPDKLHGQGYATLLDYEPGRALVFGTHAADAAAGSVPNGTWAFIVEPEGTRAARLIVRGRGAAAGSWLGTVFQRTVFEPLQFAMERRMLEGIRALSEGRSPPSRTADAFLLCSWAISFGALIVLGTLVLVGARPLRALLGFSTAGVGFQCLTFLQPPLLVALAVLCALLPFLPLTRGARAQLEPEVPHPLQQAS